MANWIKKAVNKNHIGFCTPMSKATCTPARKALAERFKRGDLHQGSHASHFKRFKKGSGHG